MHTRAATCKPISKPDDCGGCKSSSPVSVTPTLCRQLIVLSLSVDRELLFMASQAQAPAVKAASQSSRRKRKRTDENLDEAERARRQLQRQKQELALKLRAEGKIYKPQKAKTSSVKAEAASAPFKTWLSSQPHQQVTQNAQQQHQGSQQQSNAPQREETGTRPEGDVQVIIVPIFWNKKADEKTTVVAAAEEVQQQLQEQGIQVGLDTTNADTPGQKYRYWEQQGVKVRIELGPRDAHKSQACLAISTIPGEVAKKTSYQIGAQLTTAVQKALTASGITASTDTASKATDSLVPKLSGKKDKAVKKQKHQLHEDTVLEAHPNSKAGIVDKSATDQSVSAEASMDASLEKASAADQPQTKSKKTHVPSGDDLGDEFAIEIDAAEDEGAKKKKKPVGDSVPESVVADGTGKEAKLKKSKQKVVKF